MSHKKLETEKMKIPIKNENKQKEVNTSINYFDYYLLQDIEELLYNNSIEHNSPDFMEKIKGFIIKFLSKKTPLENKICQIKN